MRVLIFICLLYLFTACNSSTSGKEDGKSMDDTTGKDLHADNNSPAIKFEPVKITAAQLPAYIKFRGKLNEAWQWTDKLGENIFITSFMEPYDDKEKNKWNMWEDHSNKNTHGGNNKSGKKQLSDNKNKTPKTPT